MFCSFLLSSCLVAAGPVVATPSQTTEQTAKAFKPFTGKVTANKVRLRIKADLESHVLRQVNKNDLLLVVAEEGDFFAVEPSKETKAYIFRSYVLEDTVEANHVNVRLEPHADAPIIGQLQAGDKVHGQICPINHKWMEVSPPKGTRFYVSKEFIVPAGGPEYLAMTERRKAGAEELLNAAFMAAERECRKSYEEMSPQVPSARFQEVLHNFADFPETVSAAKEGLALFKETYLNKKISFLESKAELSPTTKEELIAKHKEESQDLFVNIPTHANLSSRELRLQNKETAGPRIWNVLEEALYLSWSAFHSGKNIDDFYIEQRANAAALTGTIDFYTPSVKEKPGNFILRGPNATAYLYSTHVDLETYVGKTVTVIASPRPNNHFAFPAYFVLAVE